MTVPVWLMLACLLTSHAFAQSSSAKTTVLTDSNQNSITVSTREQMTVPAAIHGAIKLDGPWRFHTGDDPGWADPSFDDSSWEKINLTSSLAEQGIDSYYGYGWYRLRIRPVPIPDSGQIALSLLVMPFGVGQSEVFINNVHQASTRGMSESPKMYLSPPYGVQLTQVAPDGTIVIAIRTWASVPVTHGLLDRVEIGDTQSIVEEITSERAHEWDQHVLAAVLVSFLFLCVAALGATLYLAQRNHSEYLWLSLLCLSVAIMGAIDFLYAAAFVSLPAFNILDLWAGRIFMAVTLEFVLRFTASEYRRLVRGVQIAVLLLPFIAWIPVPLVYTYLSFAARFVFCALVVALLFRAWRRGRLEAGVMLLPFILAATADSTDTVLDYAASQHWLSERFASHRFHFGPIEFSTSTVAYLVFLGSLIAVILYRFVHVSQEEQRTAAEIEAARSVQALLIPTRLPSSKSFSLDSAYLPINGVGGDFFQVLPLQDDSILLVVGDVSGKGLQAAMSASSLVGALRNELAHDPAVVLSHLNQVMLGNPTVESANSVASFATCLCARVYPSGKMVIANAGHLSPYRDGREMELAPDLPLGVIANITYEEATFQLKPGDRLIFLSDGVVEATNPQGELFGFERTQQVSHEAARYIAQIAQRFGQTDDITVVSLYFVPNAAHRVEHEAVAVH
ncbi:PP2C family protein-serine/threonine phosphatase [Acidicapsa ligni]|uniref:PP2C family protein-serine/threonine phosphatase n=1 Tax=Acidicapsa ligni TaxID=542300 RepID=UPI0021DF6DAA|nr:SpoIIE family protein phosphatase [Acidicapsa ligni]